MNGWQGSRQSQRNVQHVRVDIGRGQKKMNKILIMIIFVCLLVISGCKHDDLTRGDINEGDCVKYHLGDLSSISTFLKIDQILDDDYFIGYNPIKLGKEKDYYRISFIDKKIECPYEQDNN